MTETTVNQYYKSLCGAILEQAGQDYFNLLTGHQKPEKDCGIAECEEFFRSNWFEFLTTEDVSGERIIDLIRREALSGRKRLYKGGSVKNGV